MVSIKKLQEMTAMKILLLGAQGMLGSDLQPILSAKHEVLGKDIQDFDITDRDQVVEEIAALRPDVVINAAAFTDVDGCESHRDTAFAVNGEGAFHVALGCAHVGCKMIHFSTDYVFDGASPTPYPEDFPAHPLNVYGKSKLQGELYVRKVLQDYLIVRTAWLYGRHGKNFVDTILRLAGERDELRVVDDQRGSPTFTRDLGHAVSRLLEENIRGILHVTSSDSCTWFEFARKILELKKILPEKARVVPISSSELSRPARRPAYSVLNCSRLEQTTGLRMRIWEEGLKEYLYGL
jgi:dTDP-4-dehydrorhamnose reductase